MCVAIVCPTKFPSKYQLESCEKSNGDGGGAAWLQDGAVHWKKGISAEEITEMIDKKVISTPALLHFRIASCGGNSKELCHPFPVNKGASTDLEGQAGRVLIHNGHWWPYQMEAIAYAVKKWEKPPFGKWSDTRVLAWLTARLGDGILELADHQKIATLNSAGHIQMWPHDGWTKDDDIYYSNMGWRWTYVNDKTSRDWPRQYESIGGGVKTFKTTKQPLSEVILGTKIEEKEMTTDELINMYGTVVGP